MKKTKLVGIWGEEFACNYLGQKGYNIVDRNIKISNQEIDILAFYEDCLVIIEVKTKLASYPGRAEDMMSHNKIKNLKVAARMLVKKNRVKYRAMRFDLVALDVNKFAKTVKVRHYKDII
jgi:putative endonuclease